MVDAPDDAELLSRYAQTRDEAAFAELVQRYLALVYHAAQRQVGDVHRAEEVAQEVFTRLARKASGLTSHTSLAGWLHATTRLVALEVLRTEHRRRAREQEAFLMNEAMSGGRDPEWARIRPALDEALGELAADDREVVLWRYFLGLSWREIGVRLGAAENTARMRGDRALERLQARLARRGWTSTAALLSAGLASEAVAGVPTGLAGAVTSGALASNSAVAGAVGFAGFMSASKLGWTAGVVLLAAVVGTATWQQWQTRQEGDRVAIAKAEYVKRAADLNVVESESRQVDAAVSLLTQRLAAEKAALATSTEDANKGKWDPMTEGNALMTRYPGLKRVVLERADAINTYRYSAWMKELGLSPAQATAFIELLRHQSWIGSPFGPKGEMYMFGPAEGLSSSDMTVHMKAIVGDDGYLKWQDALRKIDAREALASLGSRLMFSDAPLSEKQAQDLLTLMMTNPSEYLAGGFARGFDFEAMGKQVESMLTPAQRPAWAKMSETYQRRQKNMRSLPEGGGKQ